MRFPEVAEAYPATPPPSEGGPGPAHFNARMVKAAQHAVHSYLLRAGKWVLVDELVRHLTPVSGARTGHGKYSEPLLQLVFKKRNFRVDFWHGQWWIRVGH